MVHRAGKSLVLYYEARADFLALTQMKTSKRKFLFYLFYIDKIVCIFIGQ